MAEGWKYRLRYTDEELELTEGKLMVGRSRHCDFSIQEPSISRKHIFLTVGAGKIRIQDLGSSNGTFVNELRVEGESTLADGDTLRLGNAVLAVEIHGPSSEAESPAPAEDPAPSLSPKPPGEAPALALPETRETQALKASGGSSPKSESPPQSGSRSSSGPFPDYLDGDPTKHVDSERDWYLLQGERAGFAPRLAAVVLDGLWVAALFWAGYATAGLAGGSAAPIMLLLVTWLGWGIWGTTPGKRLVGLYVYSQEDEMPDRPGIGLVVSAVRLAGCLLSLLLFGLGFLAVAFSTTRLALHDRLAGTFVVKKPSGRSQARFAEDIGIGSR